MALPVNLLIAAGRSDGVRDGAGEGCWGRRGSLFKGTISTFGAARGKLSERQNAKQVQLTYLHKDDSPVRLPAADDPLAAGLAAADDVVIQALVRRAEQVEMQPSFRAGGGLCAELHCGRRSLQPAGDGADGGGIGAAGI